MIGFFENGQFKPQLGEVGRAYGGVETTDDGAEYEEGYVPGVPRRRSAETNRDSEDVPAYRREWAGERAASAPGATTAGHAAVATTTPKQKLALGVAAFAGLVALVAWGEGAHAEKMAERVEKAQARAQRAAQPKWRPVGDADADRGDGSATTNENEGDQR